MGFLFTYIFTLLRFIFFDYLEWPYALIIGSFMSLSLASNINVGKVRWIFDNQDRIKQMTNVATALIPKPDSSSASSFEISDNNKSVSLTYSRMGKKQILNIPYETRTRRITNKIKVYLIKGNEEVDITHQPCIPYLCTAEQLGGDNYKIVSKDSDNDLVYVCPGIPDMDEIKDHLKL